MLRKTVKATCFVVTLMALVALTDRIARAQVEFGSLVGNVADPSGGALPGASVKITSIRTNDVRSVVTDAAGAYTISTVTPGHYRVEITRDGFTAFVATDVLVNQNNVVRVDAQLSVGSVNQKIEVTTTAVAELQTDRADVHTEINSANLQELPQPNRTYLGLLALVPGATPPGGQLSGGTNNPFKGMTYSFNGGGVVAQTVRIEGINAVMPWSTQGQNYVPSVEAIENVNVATNSTDSEQATSAGSTVQVVLKSGSNETHGGLYDYNIISKFEANNFFSPYSKPPHLVDNDTGAFLGGHIIRNKLFYFGSYEGSFSNSANSGILSIPGPVQLSGDLSGSSTPIYDPNSGKPDGSGKTPFGGNRIPISRMDPVTLKIIPSIPGTNYGAPGSVVNNYYINDANVYNLHKMDTKVDWNVNSKLRLSARYARSPYYNFQQPIYGEILGGASAFPQAQAGNYLQHGLGMAVSGSGSYVVSPTFVIDATWGETTSHQVLMPNLANQAYGRDVLGIPGMNPGPLPWYGGVPRFSISNFVQMGESYTPLDYIEPVYEYVANATKVKGAHTIRFGADYTFIHPRMIETQVPGFTFNGSGTTIKGGPGANPYNALGDFLLGTWYEGKMSVQFLQPRNEWRTKDFAAYVRDQWHVSSKLTLNYGVRWEYYPVAKRDAAAANAALGANGGGLYWLDPTAATVTVCGTPGSNMPADCGIHVSKKLFAPSIGIAYRPTNKLVIRAGYALNPYQDQMARAQYFAYPGLRLLDVIAPNPYSVAGTLSGGLAADTPPPGTNGVFPILPNTGNLGGLPTNKDFTRGYIQSYNFTIQRELPGSILGSVGYVGTHAVKLFQAIGINNGTLGGGNASQPFAFLPDYSTGISTLMPWGEDVYNSLQVMINKRMGNGFTFQSSYTYSKDIGMSTSILIPQYINYDHTTTALDRTHHMVVAATYELPFGRSKSLAKHGIGAAILGGWSLSGVFNHYSGIPFSVSSSGSTCNCPGSTQTANQILSNVNKVGSGVGGQAYFNPLAYAPVNTVSFGTSGFNTLRGPGNTNVDTSLSRTIRITERLHAQIRAEATNLTNTPHFSNPGANVSNMSLNSDGTVKNLNGYSQITSTAALGRLLDQRYFRFALRITF